MDAHEFSELLTILIVVLAIVLPFVASVMTLRQIDCAAKENNQPVKLVLADLFCLMVLVQIPLAFFFQVFENSQTIVAPAIAVAVTMILVWWKSIEAISQAGISQTSTRAIISLLVIPMAYLGSFTLSWLTLLLAFDNPEKIWPYVAEALLIALMIASYAFTRYAVKAVNLVKHERD